MKRINYVKGLVMLMVLAVIMVSTSCQKDKKTYQVKVRNSCEIELLGIPFMKYNIKEFSLGDIKFGAVAKGEDSEYKDIESDTEYAVSVTYDVYLYDANTFQWDLDRTETADLGTETWTDSEDSDKFIMKVEIGDILQAYKPIFKTYIAE